jgi:hypothetical protein
MVILAGDSPNIRSYTVYIYGFGQPYRFVHTPHGTAKSFAAAPAPPRGRLNISALSKQGICTHVLRTKQRVNSNLYLASTSDNLLFVKVHHRLPDVQPLCFWQSSERLEVACQLPERTCACDSVYVHVCACARSSIPVGNMPTEGFEEGEAPGL